MAQLRLYLAFLDSTRSSSFLLFFFFNDTATTEIYTLSLHDALPIFVVEEISDVAKGGVENVRLRNTQTNEITTLPVEGVLDRKSTRLNSSHQIISYAVFCLKKKNTTQPPQFTHCTSNAIAPHCHARF